MDVCGGSHVRDIEGADTFGLVNPSPVLFSSGDSQKATYFVRDAKKTKKTIKASYKAKAAAALGCLHVFLGLLVMTDSIVGLLYQKVPVVDGIWISIFFLISGGLAIGGSCSANMCLVVATMVMSIISAVCAALLVIAYSIALTPPMLHWRCHDTNMTAEERCVGVTKVADGLLVAKPAPQVRLQPDQGDHWVHTGYKDIVDLGGT